MMAAGLRVSGGEGERPPGRGWIAVGAGQCDRRLAIGCYARCKAQAEGRAGWQTDPLAKTQDRIEHVTGGTGECAAVERRRPFGAASAAEEPASIRLVLHLPLAAALEAEDVHHPRSRVATVSRTAAAQEGKRIRQVLRLDEQLAERRMREILGRRSEHRLDVAGDVQ